MNSQNANRYDLAQEYASARARQRSARTREAFDKATAQVADLQSRIDDDEPSCTTCGGPTYDCGSGCGL